MTLDYRDLLFDKFRYGGRGEIEKGIRYWDCYGISREVLKRVGKDLPEFNYTDDLVEIAGLIEKNRDLILEKIDKPEPYCLVAIQVVPEAVTHCGVLLNHSSFIHMTEDHGPRVDSIDSPLWKNKLRGYFRYGQRVSTTNNSL